MKILNTKQNLLDLKGENIKEKTEAGEMEITVGLIITNCLSGQTSNPHRAYQLAKEIATNDTVDLKAEDVVFIKEVLNQSKLGSVYIGQAIEILESKDTTQDATSKK